MYIPDPRIRMPPPVPDLQEADLVTPAGAIDRSMLMRIAIHRARRELGAYAAMAAPRPWAELLEEELRRTWSIARIMRDCAAGRRHVAAMTPAEQRIRRLELHLQRLRHGLATPSCAKTEDDIAHVETLLARARADQLAAIAEAAE
jgi:hypothetical protein